MPTLSCSSVCNHQHHPRIRLLSHARTVASRRTHTTCRLSSCIRPFPRALLRYVHVDQRRIDDLPNLCVCVGESAKVLIATCALAWLFSSSLAGGGRCRSGKGTGHGADLPVSWRLSWQRGHGIRHELPVRARVHECVRVARVRATHAAPSSRHP